MSTTIIKSDYIPKTYKEVLGVTISGIVIGLLAKEIGLVLHEIKGNDNNLIDL